jgi:hypothetical protein
MTLKYQTESLEGLPEAVHSFYEQGENGYTLKVEGVVPETKFKDANQRAVDAAEEARRRRATVERVTGKLGLESADGLDEALEALLSKSKAPAKDDKDQQAVLEQIKAQYEGKLTDAQKQLEAIRTDGAKSQFTSALMAAGFGEKVASMIAQSNMARVQFDEAGKMRIMQENGNPLAGSGADGFATLGDLTTELAAAMPELLTDQGKGGGGKPPASNGGTGGGLGAWSKATSAKEKAAILKSKLTK